MNYDFPTKSRKIENLNKKSSPDSFFKTSYRPVAMRKANKEHKLRLSR